MRMPPIDLWTGAPKPAFVIAFAFAIAFAAGRAGAQVEPPPPVGQATATVAAGERYHGSWLRRFLLGGTNRDLWAMPITVPVLDLATEAGGLTPTKTGGGNQTRSLRFKDAEDRDFVFRLVDKDGLSLYAGYEHTILESITRDQVSAHHPAGAIVADRLLAAAGILHPTPVLMVMPDDPRLGEFRAEFAGRLGMLEPLPGMPKHAAGFAGAIAIIDSDSLRVLLDRDPREQVDSRAYLTARLLDMLINDWDRHQGNWKWARMATDGPWEPIARDRDKVMINYGGLAARAGALVPNLIHFEATYPGLRALTVNSRDLDRRLLGGLAASAFDSSAAFLSMRLTDEVIDEALRAMPHEYEASWAGASAKLKARRDLLPDVARRFHIYLADIVDLHATDASERAIVTLVDDDHVDVELRAGTEPPYFRNRFDAGTTREIRLYLHGGDDQAVVRGEGRPPLKVRVIGGDGVNQLADSSGGAGHSGAIRFYDNGVVEGTGYGPDRPDRTFDRRPWPRPWGSTQPPGKDRGATTMPILGVAAPGDLGLVVKFGLGWAHYGFRQYPYAHRTALIAEYATGVGSWRVTGQFDQRREESRLHLTVTARMSEFEVLNYFGQGNDSAEVTSGASEVRQQQWLFLPAVAYGLGPRSDFYLGPVMRYSTVERMPVLPGGQPYGAGDFGQAGLRFGLLSDTRNRSKDPSHGMLLDLSATAYPAMWDVASHFSVFAATTAGYYVLPLPLHPVFALRAGGRKVLGEYPFHESAFIGGRPSERDLVRERYAGDASLYGSAELQVTLVRFPLVLPIDLGVYGYGDAGRVYVDGLSPGGWHDVTGVGLWVGVMNPSTAVNLELGDGRGRSGLRVRTGFTF